MAARARPWGKSAEVEIADRRWDPRASALRIVEGPPLDAGELARGQGWNAALRRGRDVTRELLRAPVTVAAPTRAGHELGVGLLVRAGFAEHDWGPVREALHAGRNPGVSAVLVTVTADGGPWLFDAGLALGGATRAAYLVAAEPGAPERAAGIDVFTPEAVAALLRPSRGSE